MPAIGARCMAGIQTWLLIQFQVELSTIYWGMFTPFWIRNFEFKMWYKVCYDWLEYIEVMHSGGIIDMLYLMLCLYESFYHTDCLWRLRSMRYRGRSTWHWWTLHYTMTTAGWHINIKMVGSDGHIYDCTHMPLWGKTAHKKLWISLTQYHVYVQVVFLFTNEFSVV